MSHHTRALGAILVNLGLALMAGVIAQHLSRSLALSLTGLFAYCGGFVMCWVLWRDAPPRS